MVHQSCFEWGGSLTKENEEDLERTHKSFTKLVLGDKYVDFETALIKLDLENLGLWRKKLKLTFGEKKFNQFFMARKTYHPMDLRHLDNYRTQK